MYSGEWAIFPKYIELYLPCVASFMEPYHVALSHKFCYVNNLNSYIRIIFY